MADDYLKALMGSPVEEEEPTGYEEQLAVSNLTGDERLLGQSTQLGAATGGIEWGVGPWQEPRTSPYEASLGRIHTPMAPVVNVPEDAMKGALRSAALGLVQEGVGFGVKKGAGAAYDKFMQTETGQEAKAWATDKYTAFKEWLNKGNTGQTAGQTGAGQGVQGGASQYGSGQGQNIGTTGGQGGGSTQAGTTQGTGAQQGGGTVQTTGGTEGGAAPAAGEGGWGTTAMTAVNVAAGFYAGYTASPAGAGFEREYLGGMSPGYLVGDVFTAFGGPAGVRTDENARRARGERLGMMGYGGAAGYMAGGTWGAVAGGAGGFLQENPYTGKRGYQENYKYELKPAAEGLGRNVDWRNATEGDVTNVFNLGKKGSFTDNLTNVQHLYEGFKSIGNLGGGSKKPPSQSEMQRDIQYQMAARSGMDYEVRQWADVLFNKGALESREYIKGGLGKDLENYTAEGMPSWMQGTVGKKNMEYNFTPVQTVEGQRRVASPWAINNLAALQSKYEEMGDKDAFFKQYLEDYDIYREGNKPLIGDWHGKQLYSIPSEMVGGTFEEMFPDLEIKNINDYAWMQQADETVQQENEEV